MSYQTSSHFVVGIYKKKFENTFDFIELLLRKVFNAQNPKIKHVNNDFFKHLELDGLQPCEANL